MHVCVFVFVCLSLSTSSPSSSYCSPFLLLPYPSFYPSLSFLSITSPLFLSYPHLPPTFSLPSLSLYPPPSRCISLSLFIPHLSLSFPPPTSLFLFPLSHSPSPSPPSLTPISLLFLTPLTLFIPSFLPFSLHSLSPQASFSISFLLSLLLPTFPILCLPAFFISLPNHPSTPSPLSMLPSFLFQNPPLLIFPLFFPPSIPPSFSLSMMLLQPIFIHSSIIVSSSKVYLTQNNNKLYTNIFFLPFCCINVLNRQAKETFFSFCPTAVHCRCACFSVIE